MKQHEAVIRLRNALSDHRLDPEHLEPWPAWKAFKQFVRNTTYADSEVLFVGLGIEHQEDKHWHLTFVRELEHVPPTLPMAPLLREDHFAQEPSEPEAVWDLVCELEYELAPNLPKEPSEYSSADYRSLEDFFAAVESDQVFQAAMALEPTASRVYGEDAV